ncbi:RNA polymerase factor sigma-54 [Acetivibrio cellulolyticus]|uniref:RNA polymerase factor sigma-54 n=1 Tax=Acetivibrio cellulolyticus TaxID=35830 RepID=UPI0001E2FB99|nr:RNA polymerase factor sigma-54 [Acetivibrio cellulolyticus]
MDFNFDLSLVQSHKIILTPQLRQAFEILKMNSRELIEYIEDEMEANPALEVNPNDIKRKEEILFPMSYENYSNDDYISSWNYNENSEEAIENISVDRASTVISLKEHLLLQLHTSDVTGKDMEVGEYLIDNVDHNGYLAVMISEAASFFNVPVKRVERVLSLIQTFDPPGVCARSIKECLGIQLAQMGNKDREVIDVIENHLEDLANNKITHIAKSMGISLERVVQIYEIIRSLEPRPGREFYEYEDIKFIIPDVVVREIDGKFQAIINEEALPILNISGYYKTILQEDINIEAKKFIQSKIDSVQWLIKCIEQRKITLSKVADSIVKHQVEFFKMGKDHIKALTMKDVAKDINMHESTVSRTVSGKFLQCSWGIFDMKLFFPGRVSTSTCKDMTSENVKLKIKEIIDSEDKKFPLNDNEIVQVLIKCGMEISRRTVAKYRTELNIPVAAKRKKY